ncbi:MAG: type 4a pilus biogenesis protein PilO [Candidatus Porifericomitaceae bacterium WSBS_2022_MAG_OTU9]
MNLEELNSLDPSDLGSAPLPVRMVIVLVLCVAAAVAVWYLFISGKRDELVQVKAEEVTLKADFRDKQAKAVDLQELREQLAQIKETFGDLLRQLPDKAEIEGLLVDISQTGLQAGLEFELFRPGKDILKEFYSELPIELVVVGNYHQFGDFVSGVSALPRIVTTHDIEISRVSNKKGSRPLRMVMKAKTYRAIELEE